MLKTISPCSVPPDASITLPGSKSISNRALLLAALAKGNSELMGLLFSDDTRAMLKALEALGVECEINEDDRCVMVQGISGIFPNQEASIYCHDAGTVARFLVPALAASGGKYDVSASAQMSARPMGPLLEALQELGVNIHTKDKLGHLPFVLESSGFNPGKLAIEGTKSSQFLSGMLMAAPYAVGTINFEISENTKRTYIDMTIAMMRDFGVKVQTTELGYRTPLQPYQGCRYQIEPDVSTGSYFWAGAALTGGRVHIKGVNASSLQGDMGFLKHLKAMGAEVGEDNEGTWVQGQGELLGIDADVRDCSDTFMTLTVLAAFAKTPTVLRNLAHTRLQESDRLASIEKGLRALGARVETTKNSIQVWPSKTRMKGTKVSSCHDHRIAMSLALAGLVIDGVSVDDAQAVNKTCPNYFNRVALLFK